MSRALMSALQHIVGAVNSTAGQQQGDCHGTDAPTGRPARAVPYHCHYRETCIWVDRWTVVSARPQINDDVQPSISNKAQLLAAVFRPYTRHSRHTPRPLTLPPLLSPSLPQQYASPTHISHTTSVCRQDARIAVPKRLQGDCRSLKLVHILQARRPSCRQPTVTC